MVWWGINIIHWISPACPSVARGRVRLSGLCRGNVVICSSAVLQWVTVVTLGPLTSHCLLTDVSFESHLCVSHYISSLCVTSHLCVSHLISVYHISSLCVASHLCVSHPHTNSRPGTNCSWMQSRVPLALAAARCSLCRMHAAEISVRPAASGRMPCSYLQTKYVSSELQNEKKILVWGWQPEKCVSRSQRRLRYSYS